MRSSMRLQIRYARKSKVTALTQKSFASRVQWGVRQQTLTMCKWFLTIVARIRAFAAVTSRMNFQLALVSEGFATGVARICHFAGVYETMWFQWTGAVIEFTTIVTLVFWRSATVWILVIDQRIIAGEFFAWNRPKNNIRSHLFTQIQWNLPHFGHIWYVFVFFCFSWTYFTWLCKLSGSLNRFWHTLHVSMSVCWSILCCSISSTLTKYRGQHWHLKTSVPSLPENDQIQECKSKESISTWSNALTMTWQMMFETLFARIFQLTVLTIELTRFHRRLSRWFVRFYFGENNVEIRLIVSACFVWMISNCVIVTDASIVVLKFDGRVIVGWNSEERT